MNGIKYQNGDNLNCKEIDSYSAPTLTYYVAVTGDDEGYLFRTLDETEAEKDYEGRLYVGFVDGKDISLMLVEKSWDLNETKKKAKYYCGLLEWAFKTSGR